MKLSEKECMACKGEILPFTPAQAEKMFLELNQDWELLDNSKKLKRVFRFKNFAVPMKLAMIIGDIAEAENHHPDLFISWGQLGVVLTTHKIKGLAESDFIFAAKVDDAYEQFSKQL